MRLVEGHGWTTNALVRRYAAVGVCCLIALALVYAWGVWHACQKAVAAQSLKAPAAE